MPTPIAHSLVGGIFYFIFSETFGFRKDKIKGDSQGEKDFSPCAHGAFSTGRGGQRSAMRGKPWVSHIDYFIWKKKLPNKFRPVFLGILFCVTYSNLLDFDFIPGIIMGNLNRFHHGISHSIGFSVIIAFVTGLVSRFVLKRSFWRIGGISLILLLIHLFMDFSTGDTSVPYGVMLFWPFSNRYYISPISIFPAFPKRASVADIVNPLNLVAYIYELFLLGPLFIVISFIRLRGIFKEK